MSREISRGMSRRPGRSQPYRRSAGGTVSNGKVMRREKSVSKRAQARKVDWDGARVLLCLVGVAAVVATGFILAVSSERKVIDNGREEAKIKGLIRDAARQQRVETLRQEAAIDTAQRQALAQPAPALRSALPVAAEARDADEAPAIGAVAVKADRQRVMPLSQAGRKAGRTAPPTRPRSRREAREPRREQRAARPARLGKAVNGRH